MSQVVWRKLFLREAWLLAQVDAKLLQMMPKLQVLLDKGT